MRPELSAGFRRIAMRVIGLLMIGLATGCELSPFGGGCDPPPPATDAGSPTALLQSDQPPYSGTQAVRGSDPHLIVGFTCPGTSKTFLAAVKVDGALASMREVECAGYGYNVTADAGPWEPPDSLWHTVEVVLDPLNLFKETDESNNRISIRLRIVEPRVVAPVTTGPQARGGR
jgi:hypothetical protein